MKIAQKSKCLDFLVGKEGKKTECYSVEKDASWKNDSRRKNATLRKMATQYSVVNLQLHFIINCIWRATENLKKN